MNKTLQDELLYVHNLESNIKSLKEILQREEQRLESFQEECNHDIVIVSKVPSPGYKVKAKCLFCGEHFSIPHSLRELPNTSTLIEACYCKKLQYHSESEIYNFITSEAKKAISKNLDITKKELGEYLKQLLKEN